LEALARFSRGVWLFLQSESGGMEIVSVLQSLGVRLPSLCLEAFHYFVVVQDCRYNQYEQFNFV
jgi:hypothetical protein